MLGKRSAIALTTSVLVLAVAACGSSAEGTGAGRPAPVSGSAPVPQVSVPEGFDNTRGWAIREGADGTRFARPVMAPRAGLVVVRGTTHDGRTSHVAAHDAETGTVRWTGGPVPRPEGKVDALPFVVNDGDDEYVVLATSGTEGGDNGLDKASDVTRLHVYDADSSGDDVAARHEITVPHTASGYELGSDGTFLVRYRNGATVVNVGTGETTPYDGDERIQAPRECGQLIGSCNDRAHVVGVTVNGPLVQGTEAFWVPGGWFSDDVVPPGASPREGSATVEVAGSPDGESVVAAWPVREGISGTQRVWAVHDGRTGEVVASVTCEQRGDGYGNPVDVRPALSDNGRYLIFDLVGFDLETGEGRCFGETDTRREIQLTSVADDGTAFGDTGDTPVAVSLTTAEARPLGEKTVVPSLIGAGVGVFSEDDGDDLLVYPRTD